VVPLFRYEMAIVEIYWINVLHEILKPKTAAHLLKNRSDVAVRDM